MTVQKGGAIQREAKPASFVLALSELELELRTVFERNGRLSDEEQRILETMRDLQAETEYVDVIRIGAMSVLEQGKPSGRFPRRVKEVIRDLSAMIEDEASATA